MINKQEVLDVYNKSNNTSYKRMENLLTVLYKRYAGLNGCIKTLRCKDGGPISYTTFRSWMYEYNIQINKKGGNHKKTKLFISTIRELDTSNMKAKEIAKKIKCTIGWTYTLLKKNNIQYKHGKRKEIMENQVESEIKKLRDI